MTLTIGHGPFGDQPAGTFNFTREGPAHVLYVEDSPRRVRAVFNDRTVVDTARATLLHETGLLPVYYLPLEDFDNELLVGSRHTSHCPFKGDARYWSVRADDRVADNAVWNYPAPIEGCPDIGAYGAIYWDRMDHWFEEDEEVFVHARDPYHRVDVVPSSRHVRVRVDGVCVAESRRPVLLFETGLPPRYYLSREEIDASVLVDSATTTRCPYKGIASYHSVRVADELRTDLVWYYHEPIPAAAGIAGRLAFFNEHVDLEVDGEPQERPRTRWS
jgi:uncharacterized protein (DUF427 family)